MTKNHYQITFTRGDDSQSFEVRYLRKIKANGAFLTHSELRVRDAGKFRQSDGSSITFDRVPETELLQEVKRQATESGAEWQITAGPQEPIWELPPGFED